MTRFAWQSRGRGLSGKVQTWRPWSTGAVVREILQEAHEPMTLKELYRVALARGVTSDFKRFSQCVADAVHNGRVRKIRFEAKYGLPN